MKVIGVTIAAALVAVLAMAFWPAATKVQYNRVSAVFPAGNIQHGKVLARACIACHGEGAPALGSPAFHPPKLRYQRPSAIFYALQDYRAGRRKSEFMGPVAQSMTDQDMRDLAIAVSDRTLRSRIPLHKGPMPDSPGHRKGEAVCGMCHGEAGLGELDGYPVIGGQYQDYLEHALAAYRSGERSNPTMQHFARTLTPDEVKLMATYFASQTALEPLK